MGIPSGTKFLQEFIFCALVIFSVLRKLIFAITTHWFFPLRINFCDFQKVPSTFPATTSCKSTWHSTVIWHKWPVHDLVLVIPPPPLIKVASNTRPCSKLGGTTLNGRDEGDQYYISQTCDQQWFEARKVVFLWECRNIFATGCSRSLWRRGKNERKNERPLLAGNQYPALIIFSFLLVTCNQGTIEIPYFLEW